MRSGYTNSDSGGSQHHRHGHGAGCYLLCVLVRQLVYDIRLITIWFGSICSGSDRFVVVRIGL